MDVAFEVVDGDERLAKAEGEGLGEGDADQQRSGEAGAGGDGDSVEVLIGAIGTLQGLADDRHNGAEVLAAGELGDHSAVVGVDKLAGDDVGEHLMPVAQHGRGGLVAGGFDAEDEVAGH